MPPVGFDPTISAGERPQTDAFDRAATGTDSVLLSNLKFGKPVWNPSRTDMTHTNCLLWMFMMSLYC